jgi:Helix-turn-helix domain
VVDLPVGETSSFVKDELMTALEVASALRFRNVVTIHRMCRAGKFPGARKVGAGGGKNWIIPRSDLDALLSAAVRARGVK